MSKQYLSIASSNGNSGVFGFSKGTPQLRFDIADRGVLQAQELRFQGTLKVQNTGTNAPPLMANDVNIDAFSGVQGVIQTLELSSRAYSSRALETIQNYPRLVASHQSALHSKAQYSTQLTHEQLSKGNGIDTASSRTDTNSETPYNKDNSLKAQRIPLCLTDGVSFDMRLVCGMMMSQDLDLEMLGGLTIELTLAPDSNFLFGANSGDFRYVIENPRLIVPIIEKTPQQQMDLANTPSNVLQFLSYTSLYNTITSTDNQIVHRTNLRSVISSFQNYVPVQFINNTNSNGLGQYNPDIKKLTFHKGASRFPLEYSILVDSDPTLNVDTQPTTYPQVLINYMDAFRNFTEVKKSCINKSLSATTDNMVYGAAPNLKGLGGVFGSGCSYDAVSHSGVSATNDTLGLEIQSNLADPTDVTVSTPFAVYTYYLCKNMVRVANNNLEVMS
tara:strand:- start:4933 stop:6267 length:1335 start_codon:yes stop_codon:yes gene_type:complete